MWKMNNNPNIMKLIVFGVVIALFFSMFCPGVVRAEGKADHTKIFVVSTETQATAIWNTAIYQDCIYVKMSDFCLACGGDKKQWKQQ